MSSQALEQDNTERYDRQIRLWGRHGQNKCSNAKVCLINVDSLGTEILRGLCLAGIGAFTILDSHKLAPEDVGCIFLPQDSVGRPRAEAVRQMLIDINDEVSGDIYPLETYLPHVTETKLDSSESEELSNHSEFWQQFNCVVASGNLYIDQLSRLSKICWFTKTPLIVCKSIGFFGTMTCQIIEHLIIETHPDNVLPDFSLDKPFSNLKQYFDSIDIDGDSELDKIGRYPYLVIVYKYLIRWQHANNYPADRLPTSHTEKRTLKSMIEEGRKNLCRRREALSDSSEPINSEILYENFLEASKAVNSCLSVSDYNLPASVSSIFNHPKICNHSPAQGESRFWLVIRALKDFVSIKNEGRLPVSGLIPDMTSSSQEYLRLQTIYAKKARQDVDSVFELAQNYLNTSSNSPGSSLFDETKLICKNIRDLQLVTTAPIHQEYDLKSYNLKEEEEEDEFVSIYLCFKALDLFFSTYGRSPGCQDDHVETDVNKLKDCMKQLIGKTSNRLKVLDQNLYEICRYGGIQLHATSAFLGGCIAQEVIKIVTNQYVPVDNTLVYNATNASTRVFKLSDVFTKC